MMTLAYKVFVASIPILISMYATKYREKDRTVRNNPKDFGLPIKETFDFIIVGGGTAGCVLARRLVDQNFTVLMLEAGGDPPPLQAVPIMSLYTDFHPDINFVYRSTPQKNSALADNGIIPVSTGKMLGGCSSHNGMIYERGHPLDYDNWAELTGDKSWSYENVLPYFLKAENYRGRFPLFNGKTRVHGRGGPMTVTSPKNIPGEELWLEAGRELGYHVQDSNGPQGVGFAPIHYNTEGGRRASTYTAYIKTMKKSRRQRQKLTIRRYSVVSKILIKNKIATGVQYTRLGIARVAMVRKEVILSAGVIMTPILLIKSGIGPLDELKAAKVDPVSILPVGHNLCNHPYLQLTPFRVSKQFYSLERNMTFHDFTHFLQKGQGPLTSFAQVMPGNAFYDSSMDNPNKKERSHSSLWPDIQITYIQNDQESKTVSCEIFLTRPKSLGRLKVNHSAIDMEDGFLPILDYNYYSDPADFDVTIAGIELCLRTLEDTKVFKQFNTHFTRTSIPECKDKKFRSRDYWICYIRYRTDRAYHTTGTCRMGRRNDPKSVVDSKLRVIGVNKLRVVDASIMPVIVNSNPAAPVVTIAEKGASDIIREYQRPPK